MLSKVKVEFENKCSEMGRRNFLIGSVAAPMLTVAQKREPLSDKERYMAQRQGTRNFEENKKPNARYNDAFVTGLAAEIHSVAILDEQDRILAKSYINPVEAGPGNTINISDWSVEIED